MSDEKSIEEIQILSEEPQEEPPPKTTSKRAKGVEVSLLAGGRDRGNHICVGTDGSAYLVPVEKCKMDQKSVFLINPDDEDIIMLYDWTKEIEAMLPTRNEMVNNVRIALWKGGAYTSDDLDKASRWKHSAFPYQFKVGD